MRRIAARSLGRRFTRAVGGAITLEIAIAASMLSLIIVALTDFGLAWVQQTAMTNSVRAGTQFALVRHPSLGPGAEQSDSIVSIQNIRDAVVESSNLLGSDPGADVLNVCIYYQCPDQPQTACTTTTGTEPGCDTWQTFLQIELSQAYVPIFNYPGLGSAVLLNANHVVRLN